jgi:hypothetical protein
VKLFPVLISKGEGKPDSQRKCGKNEFQSMAWSDWADAGLMPCCRYLRGSKSLNVPMYWKLTFPTSFEILHKVEMSSRVVTK